MTRTRLRLPQTKGRVDCGRVVDEKVQGDDIRVHFASAEQLAWLLPSSADGV